MGGSVSHAFQSVGTGHGHRVSDTTRQHVQTVFDALRANPRVTTQRLEGLLQQIPKNENILTVHDASGYNLLQKCVGANNVELVKWLLCRHTAADVNRCPCSMPLHIACLKGHNECVELLLKHGARVDAEARMCWPGPHCQNCEERGKYGIGNENMIERQSTKLQSAIYYALDGDQVHILTMLQQRCEEPWCWLYKIEFKMPFRQRKPLLHIACERAAWKCVQHLVADRQDEINMLRDEYYPIHQAVLHDNKFLELLIAAGAETTVRTCTQQMTLLHVVLLIGRKSAEDTLATIKILLDHGCKELINAPDSLANTPLHASIVRYALEEARYGYEKWNKWDILHLVRYLLQNGASPSINQPGNSALACVLRHVRDWDVCYELLNMLLTHGGEPNIVGRDGSVPIIVCLIPLINKDPLHHFTHNMKVCYLNCIRILLKYGANPNYNNQCNLTPLHVLLFTVSESITLNCDVQKKLNFEFIRNLLILLLTHGLDLTIHFSDRTKQHILKSCMDMICNVRDSKDIDYVHGFTLTFIQYGANPNISFHVAENIYSQHYQYYYPEERNESYICKISKKYLLFYYITLIWKKEKLLMDTNATFAKIIFLFYVSMSHRALYHCLKMMYTQQLSQVPLKHTEVLTNLISELYRKPRTLKQICRVQIYECMGRKPGLYVNKLNLPSTLKDYILNFDL